jgi:hypothetical protein
MENIMIKWKQSKKVPTKSKRHNGFVTLIMVGRVCDKCGKYEEAFWGTVKKSRERRGEETDYCYQCSQIGRKMPTGPAYKQWKHGKTYNGYTRITLNGSRVLEHVAVMEAHLGRKMNKGEIIHHIDMDKGNNDILNLYVFQSKSKHVACHSAMERCGYLMLNKFVWFDWKAHRYTLNETQSKTFGSLTLPTVGKIHIDKFGYPCYNICDNGKRKRRRYHLLVAESILGRELLRREFVHHVDGNKLNSDASNLCIVDSLEHTACHCALQKVVATLYKKGIVKFDGGVYQVAV